MSKKFFGRIGGICGGLGIFGGSCFGMGENIENFENYAQCFAISSKAA
jgi:hypothetical protein